MAELARTWTGEQAKAKRLALKMSQTVFWGRVMTTQSGGARYESGRAIPNAVQALLCVSCGTELQSDWQVQALKGMS